MDGRIDGRTDRRETVRCFLFCCRVARWLWPLALALALMIHDGERRRPTTDPTSCDDRVRFYVFCPPFFVPSCVCCAFSFSFSLFSFSFFRVFFPRLRSPFFCPMYYCHYSVARARSLCVCPSDRHEVAQGQRTERSVLRLTCLSWAGARCHT